MTARPASPEAAPEPVDHLVADRYRLLEVVGRGGMATIHRAQDIRTGRMVAVKILRPEISADRDLADRFRREALAATVLRHRNIVACLDTGTDALGPFLVMELVEGDDLAARLRRSGPMLPGDAARIGLDVARGLGAAHLRGIVHRDVKPGNILIARDGRAMITDFGIARLAADAEAASPGTTLGSVQYFSPEQALGRTTTPASDVYGLGLVLYEALTGQRAWHGASTSELALARVGAIAPSPRDIRLEVPIALDTIVSRALAPEPGDRYPSGNAMAAALEPLVPSVAAAPTPTSRHRPIARRGSSGNRPTRVVLAAAAVVVGLAGVGMVVRGASDGAAGPAGPTATAQAAVATTAAPTPRATATPRATPTARATATPTVIAADLCQPLLGVACGLDRGRYAPAAFQPAVAFTLGDGWSASKVADDLVVLARPEGRLVFASHIGATGDGEAFGNGTARAIIAAFAGTDGLKAKKPADLKIDGHKGRSVDVTPTDDARPALFEAGGGTYVLVTGRTTRLVALDTDDGVLILVIEPATERTLRDILDTADVVASTLDIH